MLPPSLGKVCTYISQCRWIRATDLLSTASDWRQIRLNYHPGNFKNSLLHFRGTSPTPRGPNHSFCSYPGAAETIYPFRIRVISGLYISLSAPIQYSFAVSIHPASSIISLRMALDISPTGAYYQCNHHVPATRQDVFDATPMHRLSSLCYTSPRSQHRVAGCRGQPRAISNG